MAYCTPGQLATVTYGFGRGPSTTFQTIESPIDIISTPASPIPPNYSAQGYRIDYYSPNNHQRYYELVHAHQFGQVSTWVYNYDYGYDSYQNPTPIAYAWLYGFPDGYLADQRELFTISCGDSVLKLRCVVDTFSLTINPNEHCPNLVTGGTGNFKIMGGNPSQPLLDISGIGNPYFTVACGDACPPNHIRCTTTGYPGYCCIPCGSLAARINNLYNRF